MSSDSPKTLIREHDRVALLRDLPDDALIKGDVGVVVYEYENAEAYEVEFPNPTGGKPRFLVVTVEASALLKLQPPARAAIST